ncbi:hypothetical protein KZZ52_56980 [Dactylosporangium sp. AC04546]|uniref:hypothetical protein n=1 Tax=Dactylosporangium sp. AC04546 TaxID=2862460 RepID=UPI001EDDDB94|nr:hypothetical protein [Dactylosporangium sp. AC04546]WVK83307.1 hypothetical protein KZZ52_56980 [Dactylosporangium sp. AC04546]
MRIVTDGTREDAERFIAGLQEEDVELDQLDDPDDNPVPDGGEVLAVWEDPHGQWDLALVRL